MDRPIHYSYTVFVCRTVTEYKDNNYYLVPPSLNVVRHFARIQKLVNWGQKIIHVNLFFSSIKIVSIVATQSFKNLKIEFTQKLNIL